jgi:hypothetical protein
MFVNFVKDGAGKRILFLRALNYIYAWTLKTYDILKVNNAFEKAVY